MDSLVSFFKLALVVGVLFLLVAGFVGYGCKSCTRINPKDLAETPCVPVLPNGETNPHYRNTWGSCYSGCSPKSAQVDIKTCDCTCGR